MKTKRNRKTRKRRAGGAVITKSIRKKFRWPNWTVRLPSWKVGWPNWMKSRKSNHGNKWNMTDEEAEKALKKHKANLTDAKAGYLISLKGDLSGVEAEYRAALKLDPTDDLTRVLLANVLEAKGDLSGAKAEYQKAFKLDANPIPEVEPFDFTLDPSYRRPLEVLPLNFDFISGPFEDTAILSPNKVALSEEDLSHSMLQKALKHNQSYLEWVRKYYSETLPHVNEDTSVSQDTMIARETAMKNTYQQIQLRNAILTLKMNSPKDLPKEQKLLEFVNKKPYYKEGRVVSAPRSLPKSGELTLSDYTEEYRTQHPGITDFFVEKSKLLPIDFNFEDGPFKDDAADQWSPNSVALSTESISCEHLKTALKRNLSYLHWVQQYYAEHKFVRFNTNRDKSISTSEWFKRADAMKATYQQIQQRNKILNIKIEKCELQDAQRLLQEYNAKPYYKEPLNVQLAVD
jgi:hypothetical protein